MKQKLHEYYAWLARWTTSEIRVEPYDFHAVLEAVKSPSVIWVCRRIEAVNMDDALSQARRIKAEGGGELTWLGVADAQHKKLMSKTETQVTCPKCGQGGFIKLSAHKCDKKPKEIILDAGEPVKTTRVALAKNVGDMTKAEFQKRLNEVAPVVKQPGKAEAKQLTKLYKDAQAGMRRVIALGMYCLQIKQNLGHGPFGKWVEENCKDVSYRSVKAYMLLTSNVIEASGLQMGSVLPICEGGKQLLISDKKVSPEAKPVRDQIFAMIDGKSQRQLMLEFREEEAEAATPAAGNAKRKFHPAKPANAAEIVEAQQRDAMERADAMIAMINVYPTTDDNSLVTDAKRDEILSACVELSNFLRASKKTKKD